jgi:hypothetical protein
MWNDGPDIWWISQEQTFEAMIPCLLAEYALPPFELTIPPIDEQLTMLPRCRVIVAVCGRSGEVR